MQNNRWRARIHTAPFRWRFAMLLALACLVFAAAGSSVRADMLTFDDVGTPDQIMALYPGWSYYQGGSGKASLETGVTGNCFSAGFGNGFSPVYLSYAFPQPSDTMYIAFSLKVGPVERMLARLELLRLTSAGQTDVRVHLVENRQILVSTNVTGSLIEHYPGAYWWPNKWTRLVFGIKKGPLGYLKVWADGACIYSNSFSTGTKLIDGLMIGLTRGWDGERVTGTIMLDDISLGTSFAEVGAEPARVVTVNCDVQRTVNPDCFGVGLGWYGWGWLADYPKVRALVRQLGVGSGRAYLQSYADWDYHWPYFTYKRKATDPRGATIEEHLISMSTARDPLMICVMNMFGEKGSDWRPEKSAELVRFNQTYARPDGGTGLRGIYELGNEPSLYGPVTEGWYHLVSGNQYVQIGNGQTTYRSVRTAACPEYLSNDKTAYNYRLNFAPGDHLYIGQRWRFNSLAYALANGGSVSGDKTLRWEYWNGAEWIRFGDVSHCPFLESPTLAHNLKSSSGWNGIKWDDTAMENWTRTSMAGISGNSNLSKEALYWIRIAHESGRYSGYPPTEKFVYVMMSGSGYLEAMERFYPVISEAGGEMYAAPGIDGAAQEFLDVMEQNPALFDGVAWHSYPDPPISTAMQAGQTYAPATSMLWSVDCLTDRAVELHERFPGKKIALTEWNAGSAPTAPLRTLAGGLRTAIGLCQIVSSGWDSAIYHKAFSGYYDPYSLVVGPTTLPRLRPSGVAFKAVRDHSKQYVLDTASTYRGIYACAFGGFDTSDGALVIVNRTATMETVSLNLPQEWKNVLAVYEMAALSLSLDNETADKVTLKRKMPLVLDPSMTMSYKFPPYSLTIFDTEL